MTLTNLLLALILDRLIGYGIRRDSPETKHPELIAFAYVAGILIFYEFVLSH